MKVEVKEYEGCFAIELEAEGMAEAALLTRMGMNSTVSVRRLLTSVKQDGSFSSSAVFPKHRRHSEYIPRRGARK